VLISIGAVVICVHAVLNTVFRGVGFITSYFLWTAWALTAALVCLWRAFNCPPSVRIHWRLVTASLLFIFVAILIEAPAEIIFKAVPTVASLGDFFFFSAFVPILLAVTLPHEDVSDRFTLLLDALQAAACTWLAYTVLFGKLPLAAGPDQAMLYAPLEYVYDAEYLVVVLLTALRFILGTRGAAARSFFRSLLIYTSLYAVTSAVYNHFVGKYSLTNWMDALNDIPFAALALAAWFAPSVDATGSTVASRPAILRFIDNARPVILSLALIGLSVIVAIRHFAVAFAFIFGAFIVYSFRAARLQSKIQSAQAALEQSNGRLSEIALLDGLTGIPNRRRFDQFLTVEWARSRRNRQPLSLVLIDVDHFKLINDTYGHQVGDECLRQTARVLSATLDRPTDLLARYGGDEFAVLLAGTGLEGATTVATRIRSAIARSANTATLSLGTLSIGVATWNAEAASSPEQLIGAADRALYLAKRNGRNRVESSSLQDSLASLSTSVE
jgi:diguanylate cyclase (GGDEF)-like protein